MVKRSINKESLIAPCGMNCSVCMAYLRGNNKCPGCNVDYPKKCFTRSNCKIKNCSNLTDTKSKYCFNCDKFPCERLENLDKRYRSKYNMSMIDNLNNIKIFGLEKFVKNENIRWKCSNCGGTICVHKGYCFAYGELGKISSNIE